MPEFLHDVTVHAPSALALVSVLRLAGGLGDEGTHWKVRNLGGSRFAIRFKRLGHAALFRSGVARKGHTVEDDTL
jgi:hypothetical protein